MVNSLFFALRFLENKVIPNCWLGLLFSLNQVSLSIILAWWGGALKAGKGEARQNEGTKWVMHNNNCLIQFNTGKENWLQVEKKDTHHEILGTAASEGRATRSLI